MARTKTTVQKKNRKTGMVTVAVDGNMLRLQFPSSTSKKIWNTRQKYKALGLLNTPENMAKAQEIAAIAQMDIFRDELDVTLQKYSPFNLEKTIEKIQPNSPSALELCQRYYEEIKKPNSEVATKEVYENFLRAIKTCPDADIIQDAISIRDSIRKVRSVNRTRLILNFIYNVVNWAKRNGLIQKSTENPYKDLKIDVVGKVKYKKPKHIQEFLGEEGEDREDDDYRAYPPHEAKAIVESFAYRGKPKGIYQELIEFLFLTGCRTGEAIALRWEDVSDDCSEIIFRHSYCRFGKKLKSLKTARHGKTSRKFPCGEKLKNLLLNFRDNQTEPLNPKTFVFRRDGKPIDYASFRELWAGRIGRKGIIHKLIEEKKVETYLKPYSTRHSFITWQLASGMTPADVAKLVGNTPEMIYKHYVSSSQDVRVAFEL